MTAMDPSMTKALAEQLLADTRREARDAALEEARQAIATAAKGRPRGVSGLRQAVNIVREIQMGMKQ